MTYGDQGFRFRGDGFRDEPDFRPDTGSTTPVYKPPATYQPDEYPAPDPTPPQGSPRRRVSSAELDDVFDDPHLGDPGMDRMTVHAVWELVLLLATGGLAIWLYHSHRTTLSGDNLRTLLLSATALGFAGLGAGLSLRAGAVNLAIGPIFAASALFFATHSDGGLVATIGVVLLLAAGVGVAIGAATVIFHVPAWAASLAGALAVIVWIQKHTTVAPVTATYHPDRQAFYWYGGFIALALLGGFLGLVKPLRRGLGRYRPVADPALRRGSGAGIVAVAAMAGSSLLAGLAGVLAALSSTQVAATDGFLTTGLALGVALLGGTSAFGRRGGIFGTVLTATLLTLVMSYSDVAKLRISPYALAAGVVGIGLVVTRLVETYGRPASARAVATIAAPEEEESWISPSRLEAAAGNGLGGAGHSAPRQGSWGSQLPARSSDDTWGGAADDRWGVR
jgi:ribose/xylose/arabinose/galactoside ABC-type transport system permease subunit